MGRLLQPRRHSTQWLKRSRLAGLLGQCVVLTGDWVGRKQTNFLCGDENFENGWLKMA